MARPLSPSRLLREEDLKSSFWQIQFEWQSVIGLSGRPSDRGLCHVGIQFAGVECYH